MARALLYHKRRQQRDSECSASRVSAAPELAACGQKKEARPSVDNSRERECCVLGRAQGPVIPGMVARLLEKCAPENLFCSMTKDLIFLACLRSWLCTRAGAGLLCTKRMVLC